MTGKPVAVPLFIVASALFLSLAACTRPQNSAEQTIAQIRTTIQRYNYLLADGYRTLNMTQLQEVATTRQAEKAYFHMAAFSEGKLRLESTLKKVEFVSISLPSQDTAQAKTRETWDYTHREIQTGKKFAEERDFIYDMDYTLAKQQGRWMITDVVAVKGTSTNAVIPWPEIDRQGNRSYPQGKSSDRHP